mmetsp:Transcript_35261/g.57577  ORF Transcript_35261/g.57577 Transcript_35261/m.57577 type:complete len:88 (+) Transcript_35261:259-522(+)
MQTSWTSPIPASLKHPGMRSILSLPSSVLLKELELKASQCPISGPPTEPDLQPTQSSPISGLLKDLELQTNQMVPTPARMDIHSQSR